MRKRRTRADRERTLNHILELKVAGKSDIQIRQELDMQRRNYEKYMVLLKDRFTNEMLAQREEYFSESIAEAIEGMNKDIQVLNAVMNDPKASPTAKVMAAKEDRDTRMFKLRTMSEANAWAQALKQKMIPPAKQVLPQDVIIQ
jgi:hypothetical protein